MENIFNNYDWHDSTLRNIVIDRTSDTIMISIEWPDNTVSDVIFEDCYAFISNMNFGIMTPENILMAEAISNNTEESTLIKDKWRKIGIELDNLIEFRIETNSTASIIRIFALKVSFKVSESDAFTQK